MVAGRIVKASKPVIIAARFLPNFFEMIGARTNATTAEATTDNDICPNWPVENPQKNELM